MNEYRVIGGSVSAHCCFDATLVKERFPAVDQYYVGKYGFDFEQICEFHDYEEAEEICAILNNKAGNHE